MNGVMVMQIKVNNKIRQKIKEYQAQTGTSQVWIADQIGISKSRLYQICGAENMMIDVAMKFAIFFDCKIDDLFEYKVIENSKNIID